MANRSKEISFYSEQLGKQISGTYSLSGRLLTVTTLDGRQQRAPAGGGNPEILARLALVALETKNPARTQTTNFERQRRQSSRR